MTPEEKEVIDAAVAAVGGADTWHPKGNLARAVAALLRSREPKPRYWVDTEREWHYVRDEAKQFAEPICRCNNIKTAETIAALFNREKAAP